MRDYSEVAKRVYLVHKIIDGETEETAVFDNRFSAMNYAKAMGHNGVNGYCYGIEPKKVIKHVNLATGEPIMYVPNC